MHSKSLKNLICYCKQEPELFHTKYLVDYNQMHHQTRNSKNYLINRLNDVNKLHTETFKRDPQTIPPPECMSHSPSVRVRFGASAPAVWAPALSSWR